MEVQGVPQPNEMHINGVPVGTCPVFRTAVRMALFQKPNESNFQTFIYRVLFLTACAVDDISASRSKLSSVAPT